MLSHAPRGWVTLALTLVACGSDPRASAQPPVTTRARAFDPSMVAAAPALSCLPYSTGAIQHAVHVGTDAIAITRTLDPLRASGYDGMDDLHVLELRRTSDLGVIWARVLASPPTALAASVDARRVAIGTHASTQVLDVAAATLVLERTGTAFALAFGPSGELAISHGQTVDVLDASGAQARTIAITGTAPTVIHAMMMDGTCQRTFDDTEAHAGVLAFASDGALVASVSDGSVRVLLGDDTRRWLRPFEHSWGYRLTAVALEPLSGGTIRATYGDAFAVTLRTSTMTASATRAMDCSASERAIAQRRLGASAVGEPITCASARSTDVDASGRRLLLGAVALVHTAGGRSLLAAPTLHGEAGLLVGDEAWLFGIEGTGERWALGASGGTFVGALPIPGRTGAVLDGSEDGRWVAVVSRDLEPHGSESYDGGTLHVVDTRSETIASGLTAYGARARFVPGTSRVALETFANGHRTIEIREVPGGARVRRVDLAAAEYGGLVAVSARHLVVAEGPHVRVVSVADGSERTIDLPPCAIEAASLVGDRLAMRVYDQTTPDIGGHRIEIVDLSLSTLTSLARIAGASGHDVALSSDGAFAMYVAADGVAQRVDVTTGSVSPLSGVPQGLSGIAQTRGGVLYARRDTIAESIWLGATQTETIVLDWTRGADLAGAAIVYELGGAAYVIGHDGHTRATLHAIDGGLVVRAVSGAFSATQDARAALSVRDGDGMRACDASMESSHVPGLLEALVAP